MTYIASLWEAGYHISNSVSIICLSLFWRISKPMSSISNNTIMSLPVGFLLHATNQEKKLSYFCNYFKYVLECDFFKLNLLGWHWLIRSYRFQVYSSIVLCANHLKSNHLLSPYIKPPSIPFSLAATTLLSVSMSFSFMSHIWVKSYGS